MKPRLERFITHGGITVGGQAQILPVGSAEGEDDDDSADFGTSYGIAGTVDYAVHRNFSVGFAPRLILGIKGEDASDDSDSSSQLDLAVRLTGHAPVEPKVDLFGYLSPGYSFLFLPDAANDAGIDDPSGFILGFGGGAAFKVTPTLSVVGDIGYTLGFQSTTVRVLGQEVDGDFKTNFLHIGLGLQATI